MGTGTTVTGTSVVAAAKPTGTQPITLPCKNDSECDSNCCGFNTGKCAGPIIAQTRDGGCGFGNPTPNDGGARATRGQAPVQGSSSSSPAQSNGTATDTGAEVITLADTGATETATATAVQATGTQFITGPCKSDAECDSSCCGFNTGKCAGPIVAQTRDGGCGFGNPTPNDDAARKFRDNQA